MPEKDDLRTLNPEETPLKKMDEKEKPQLTIKFNKWGMLFIFLFVATLGYLILAPFAYLPPFEFNTVLNKYEINELLFTILGICMLIFLGLGIYFGWIREEKPESLEETDEEPRFDKREEQGQQITFALLEDKENESIKEEDNAERKTN